MGDSSWWKQKKIEPRVFVGTNIRTDILDLKAVHTLYLKIQSGQGSSPQIVKFLG